MDTKYINNLIKIFTILYIIIYPLVPISNTIGTIHFNTDYILYFICLIILIGVMINKKFRSSFIGDIKEFLKSYLGILLIVLNLVMYLSILYATEKRVAFTQSIRFSMYLIIFFIISYVIKEKRVIDKLLNISFLVSIFVSSYAIYQFIYNKFLSKTIVWNFRVGSFLENSNNLGAYLIFFVFIATNLIFKSKNKREKVFYFVATMVLLSGIILCGSRNALLAVVLGVFLLAFSYDKRNVIWGIFLVVLLLLVPISRTRIMQVFDMNQNSSRIKIWKISCDIIRDNKCLGIGYENFYSAYPKYLNKSKENLMISKSYRPSHPHNVFLKFQTELGVLGNISFLLFLLISFKFIKDIMKKNGNIIIKEKCKPLGLSFVIFQGMNLIDCYYGIPKLMITMFLFLGIMNFYQRMDVNE